MSKVKFELPKRCRNIYFWIGLLGVVLTAMGVSPEMFTDWSVVVEQVKGLFSNPFMLGSVIVAIVGVIVDPTTKGLTDNKESSENGRAKD